jgi:transaldolase / glucose-6-phosphate isomerase
MTGPTTATPLSQLSALGTSVWLDSIRRGIIENGELERLVSEDSVVGVTANPAIFEKAILGSSDYDDRLAQLAREDASVAGIYETLAVEDVRAAADILRPVYDRTDALDGYVSLEVAPELAHDADRTVESVADFWARLDRPNVMIKIPGTREGAEAIRRSIALGINVNVTLLFSLDAYDAVAEAYLSGLQSRVDQGKPIDGINSVASFFVSRIDALVDRRLEELSRQDLQGKAAVAQARLAYAHYKQLTTSDRFKALAEQGARKQRLLWASTGTKNPHYSDIKYVEELVGPETVSTIPTATLFHYQQHGRPEDTLSSSEAAARQTIAEIEAASISMADITEELLSDGIQAFQGSMDKLFAGIQQRRDAVLAGPPEGVSARLTDAQTESVARELDWAKKSQLNQRIWRKDHTLWSQSPSETANRLGWLTSPDCMLESVYELRAFCAEAQAQGFTDCVLLGMGGSSLAPQVFSNSYPPNHGSLQLHVLDSTHPDAIWAVANDVALDKTLFLVSSKSGTTLEVESLYSYFRELVADKSQFVAITDPDTPLDFLARREGFRRVFLNDPDIGGRYSALSYFGLVPAALIGVDIEGVLERAEVAIHTTQAGLSFESSPAAWLGLCMAAMAKQGRDKLTVIADPPLASFGLWLEQLVAESTGKQETGIVPVVDEPLGLPESYSDDRLFVHVRNEASGETQADRALTELEQRGHPVLTVPFADPIDLGAQFFLWEFAVCVACACLGINAFDQPNVKESKDLTQETIESYRRLGYLQAGERSASDGSIDIYNSSHGSVTAAISELLKDARQGDYVALMAYLPPSERIDSLLEALRRAIFTRRAVATTSGYGPRFLHSTGQLHKGGPRTGRFLQITADSQHRVSAQSLDYDFQTLIAAQALGDLHALNGRGLPVLGIHLRGDLASGLSALVDKFEQVA